MSIPMTSQTPNADDSEDFGIDLVPPKKSIPKKNDEDDWESRSIDMQEYSKSPEAEQAGIWNYVTDAVIQPSLGALKYYTWPADVLKIGMIGEGLSDIDELEAISKREGVEFDKDNYIKNVFRQSEFIPTQDLAEDYATKLTGVDFEPKTKLGKFLNKLFFLRETLKGKGLAKSLKDAAKGAGTTEAIKSLGGNEAASDFIGDLVTGNASNLKEIPRNLSQNSRELRDIGDKYGLPFLENMNKDTLSYTAKITKRRQAALDKKLGTTSKEAIDKIIEGKIPISKIKNQGVDLGAFEDYAYDEAKKLAAKNTKPLNTSSMVSEIDSEIARIKNLAPSQSEGQKAAIKILEQEKEILLTAKPTTEQLINQRQNYNQNVKSIYKKSERTGVEDEIKNAYGFLNGSIDRTIESQAGKKVADTYKVAREIYGQNQALSRTQGLLNSVFENGTYNPKKLNRLLNSKRGTKLRQDLGEQGVKDLQEIAKYGEKAQQATKQYAASGNHNFNIKDWGPLAGFLLAKMPKTTGVLLAAKPFADYIHGYLLTRPASRTIYKDILKNAANGSFNSMAIDFAKLESNIIDEFGSMDDFIKAGINDLQIFNDEKD